MGALFAWPSELKHDSYGVALTFVVPAVRCNLDCSFCAVRQRREAAGAILTPADYAYFLEDVATANETAIAAIQGYEPLLPESWPFTSAILGTAQRLSLPSAIVTNGILLEERARDLAALGPTGVTVSIDSAEAAIHDRIRGRHGALDTTLAGVRALAAIDDFADRLTISSVLLPRRRHFLESMPRMLAGLGLRKWVISPILRIGKSSIGGPVGESAEIIADLAALEVLAMDEGITVILDDELGRLPPNVDFRHLTVRRFARPDGLIRLTPAGACSVGADILREVGPETPVWDPMAQSPRAFLATLRPTPLPSTAMEAA